MKLTKTRGTTRDTRGTEFKYVVLSTYHNWGELEDRVYMDDMGFGKKAKTLAELKKKMGNI